MKGLGRPDPVEWVIIALVFLLSTGVMVSAYSRTHRRSEACREILTLAETRTDTLNVRLACEVRRGIR